jgi:branched-chain amino acid transport system permease protein
MAGSTSDRTRRVEPDESTLKLLDPRPLGTRHKLGIVGLLILAILPLFLEILIVIRLTAAFYIGMFAMSWDVVSGYTGEISFGHAFFFALGGYTSAVLSLNMGLHPFITIIAGVLVAALGGLLIGVPALRVEGPYLSLITIIAPLLLFQLFIVFSDTFGGETGIPETPPQIIGVQENAVFTIQDMSVEALNWSVIDVVRVLNFYLALVLFTAILLGLYAITRSNAGAVFYAIRSGEDVVAATGKNPAKFKIFVFVLSAAVGGLAGGFFVHSNVGVPAPSALIDLEVSILVIIAAVVGGMGTIVGAGIGGFFVETLDLVILNDIEEKFYGIDFTWFNDIIGYQVAEMSFLLLGVFAIAMVYAAPGGMLRSAIRLGDTVRTRVNELRGKS